MLKKILILCLLIPFHIASAEELDIIVSIKPFYNIVQAITGNLQQPSLLLKGQSSPHHYSLKPSELQGLLNADLVFWGGPELEVFLNKPLQNIAQNKVIQFNKLKTLAILPFRQQDLMHHHDEHAHTHHHHTHLFDPHFWLDPNNALQLADHIRAVLCERDPDHCRHYQDNYAIFKTKLEKLTQALAKELKPYQNTKFLVLHDAYQYFEKHYHLQSRGAIHIDPEIPLSAKRVQSLRQIIQQEKIHCLFGEPQFEVKILHQLSQQFNCQVGTLDPIGQDQDLGPDGYLKLQENLVNALLSCFKKEVKHTNDP